MQNYSFMINIGGLLSKSKIVSTSFLCFVIMPLFAQDIVISTPKQRLLPMENPIEIIVDGYSFESLYMTASNGTVRKLDKRFLVHPEKPGNTCLDIYSISGIDTIHVGKKCIQVHSFLPYTEVMLLGARKGKISKKILIAQIGLSSEVINQEISLSFPITSFRLIIMRGDSLIYTNVFNSHRFDNEIKDAFKLTEPGDMLHFLEIVATDRVRKFNLDGISVMVE